jgi:flagellar biosynthetic protein FliP
MHYLEMVIAMFIGMGVLWPVWIGLLNLIGQPGLGDRDDLAAMTMALNMAIGMAAWMRFRRHLWAPILEMSAAMVFPFVALLVPYWTGAVDGETLLTGGHVLMFVTMLLAMLWRRSEYTADHSAHAGRAVHRRDALPGGLVRPANRLGGPSLSG